MTNTETPVTSYRRYFWATLVAATLIRILISGMFGLSTDESHYALYSRNLAWGYFDHPPMVAFLGAATTVFGESAFLFRLGPIACWALSMVLLRLLVLDLYDDERLAFGVLVFNLLMPMQQLLAVALLPDATLNLFWCGALLAMYRAMERGTWRWWLLCGVLFGGTLLSKYHGVLLPLCIVSYVLASRARWSWLRSPKPYVALALGLLVFSPNIIWNARHEWISYAFQLAHGGGKGGFAMAKLGESIAGQMLAASPVFFVMLVASYVSLARGGFASESDRFVFWTGLPVFVFFCGIGSVGKILPHWPAVGWWTGAIAVVAVTLRAVDGGGKRARLWSRMTKAGIVLAVLMVGLVYASIAYPIIGVLHEKARILSERVRFLKPLGPFKSSYDITNDMYGWSEAAERVEGIRLSMPDPDRTFVFCHRFFTTSQLALYLGRETVATSLNRNPGQYGLWFDEEKHRGWDAVFVDDNHYFQGRERYLGLFERADQDPITIEIRRHGQVAHTQRVYKYYGFKGSRERH